MSTKEGCFICLIVLSIWTNTGYGNSVNTDRSLATINNEFAIDVLKQTNAKKNQFFSPFSIHSAFSALSLGAKGETLDQLTKALHATVKKGTYEKRAVESYPDLNKKLARNEKDLYLTVVSGVFADKSTKFLKNFTDDSSKYFGIKVESLNFIDKPQESAHYINDWVSNQTNGKINEVVTDDDVDKNTRLFLVNAIHFKARWKYEFNPNLTEEMDFYMSGPKSKKVPMMYLEKTKLKHAIVESLSCTALELPYVDEDLSMIVLLPDSIETPLDEIKKNITTDILDSINFSIEDVVLLLPRFKIESKYQLTDIFKKLGVEHIFSPEKSDLQGIDGTQGLYVSKAVHKAIIEVNEEGTKVAVATSIGVKTRKALHLIVNADHPFLFFIRENTSGVILFFGQIVNL